MVSANTHHSAPLLPLFPFIPAQAGIHLHYAPDCRDRPASSMFWIPAFAGMMRSRGVVARRCAHATLSGFAVCFQTPARDLSTCPHAVLPALTLLP